MTKRIVVDFYYKDDNHYSFCTDLESTEANKGLIRASLTNWDSKYVVLPNNWDNWVLSESSER